MTFFNRMKSSTPVVINLRGNVPQIFGHERNISFTSEDSASSRMLQISDIIATFTNRLFTKIWTFADETEYSEAENAFVAYYTMAKNKFGSIFVDFVFSSKCDHNIYKIILKKMSEQT